MAKRSTRPVAGSAQRFVESGISVPVGVTVINRALKALKSCPKSFKVAKWHFLAIAVARGTKVGALLHRCIHVVYQAVRPYAGTYLGDLVLGFLFELGFKLCLGTLRIGQLHSKFLRLKFEHVQRLHLGESCG